MITLSDLGSHEATAGLLKFYFFSYSYAAVDNIIFN